jgi:hypothetical protein
MSIETLTNVGPVRWGVMLAQGWKGEPAATGRPESWVVARDWASQVELLGFHGVGCSITSSPIRRETTARCLRRGPRWPRCRG